MLILWLIVVHSADIIVNSMVDIWRYPWIAGLFHGTLQTQMDDDMGFPHDSGNQFIQVMDDWLVVFRHPSEK